MPIPFSATFLGQWIHSHDHDVDGKKELKVPLLPGFEIFTTTVIKHYKTASISTRTLNSICGCEGERTPRLVPLATKQHELEIPVELEVCLEL